MRGYPARGRHVRWRVRSFEQGSIGVWARSLVRAVGNDEAMTCGPCVGRASSPFCVARIPERKELRSEAARARRPSSPLQSPRHKLGLRTRTCAVVSHIHATYTLCAENITLISRHWRKSWKVVELSSAYRSGEFFNSLHSPFLSFGSSCSCVPRWSIHSELLDIALGV